MRGPVLAVHGGAGALPGAEADPAYEAAARRGLGDALAAGRRVLDGGGSAVEACVCAAAILEDCAVFNAGRGSVLTASGTVEMDAAVMDGRERRAGAVATVRRIVHPVRAALAVMEASPHVLLAGEAAETFARERGLALADPERFVTARRREQLAHAAWGAAEEPGTVGAVARDAKGHLAAATSTGGMTGKWPGRVSDSCLVGAGTWADDETCAVSGTGHGEIFIRCAFAHEVDALLRHGRRELGAACREALDGLAARGGRGGCIAVDAEGRIARLYNTPAMPCGVVVADGASRVAIRPEEWGASEP